MVFCSGELVTYEMKGTSSTCSFFEFINNKRSSSRSTVNRSDFREKNVRKLYSLQ